MKTQNDPTVTLLWMITLFKMYVALMFRNKQIHQESQGCEVRSDQSNSWKISATLGGFKIYAEKKKERAKIMALLESNFENWLSFLEESRFFFFIIILLPWT